VVTSNTKFNFFFFCTNQIPSQFQTDDDDYTWPYGGPGLAMENVELVEAFENLYLDDENV